ncbi:hypothetical protein HY346_02560 [Candidatus Microgenomates bacterium]|nr:hypothetical protein [Candidatus Microgenomates bacterium]
MRDQAWLEQLLSHIWDEHFHDVPHGLPIKVVFGKRARTRLGSISVDPSLNIAVIRVTSLFKDPNVPEVVIKATLVHELCHYAHGFHSGLKRKHPQPHANGVIRQEFAERGLEDLYLTQKRWLKTNWAKIVKAHYPNLRLQPRRRRVRIRPFKF